MQSIESKYCKTGEKADKNECKVSLRCSRSQKLAVQKAFIRAEKFQKKKNKTQDPVHDRDGKGYWRALEFWFQRTVFHEDQEIPIQEIFSEQKK